MHCDAVADVVAGTRSPATVHIRTWLKVTEQAEDIALRLSGGVRKAYYLRVRDGQVHVTRSKSNTKQHEPTSEYVKSLFEQYDPHPVRASEVIWDVE